MEIKITYSIGGVRKHTNVKTIEYKTSEGIINVLDVRNKNIPEKDLIKIAEKYNIPVLSKTLILPFGKRIKDFL